MVDFVSGTWSRMCSRVCPIPRSCMRNQGVDQSLNGCPSSKRFRLDPTDDYRHGERLLSSSRCCYPPIRSVHWTRLGHLLLFFWLRALSLTSIFSSCHTSCSCQYAFTGRCIRAARAARPPQVCRECNTFLPRSHLGPY